MSDVGLSQRDPDATDTGQTSRCRIRRIVVLCHAEQEFRPGYFLAHIVEHWRREGREVIVHRGLGKPPEADAAVLHVDLTRVPEAYLDLAAGFPFCINGRVGDISKRRVSRALIQRGDDYEGPVIVKTDLNAGGHSERELARRRGGVSKLRVKLLDLLPPRYGGRIGDYLWFRQKTDVPGWVWHRRDLLVERLQCERQGEHFILRQWFFFGQGGLVSILHGSGPLVKISNVVERRPFESEVPEELQRFRAELGFNYGKFDYVMVDSHPVLLDANSTPYQGPDTGRSRFLQLISILASGIEDYSEIR